MPTIEQLALDNMSTGARRALEVGSASRRATELCQGPSQSGGTRLDTVWALMGITIHDVEAVREQYGGTGAEIWPSHQRDPFCLCGVRLAWEAKLTLLEARLE